jgi:serine/threonine protein kinase
MSLEGQTLGKYRVLDALGRGGMARVYRAYHPQLERYVAIKVMRADLLQEDEQLGGAWGERFRREARAVAALRHPNVVHVFDFDVQDDISYMVMELLEGDTLKARLNAYRQRGERMPPGEIVRILLDVLDGLAYAHREGMIHRDIKPANILLTRQGQAVLTDFGIAQIVGATRYTVSGALMGTLNYMAPEQGLEARCDARSDLYSLGIVLYEMLTNRTPFDADTPLAILMKHLNDPLPLPRQVVPAIPEALERVVLKALAKDPADRYQGAPEMARALGEAAAEAEIEVPDVISLPFSSTSGMGFTTSEEPAESVAVLSGTDRKQVLDAKFAGDRTDVTLGQQLETERRTGGTARKAVGAAERRAQRKATREAERRARHVAPRRAAHDKWWTASAFSRPFSLSALSPERVGAGWAVVGAVALVALVNLAMVWIGGATGIWEIYERGWPIELLAVSAGLALIMWATGSFWLLIPLGITLGNGLIFAYCQLANHWRAWIFLWPLEPILIGGSIWIAGRLARREDLPAHLSHDLGCALGLAALIWSALIGAVSVLIGLIR